MAELSVLGSGWAFPLSFTPDKGGVRPLGAVSQATDVEKVRMAIEQVLGTLIGSRIMRRNFGSALRSIVFSPNDESFALLAEHVIRESIQAWEKRVIVGSVEVSNVNRDEGRVDITVNFKVVKTQQFGSLVYPFYLTQAAE